MSEAFWNPELAKVLSGQDDAHITTEGGRPVPDVDRDVEDFAQRSADELALGFGELHMQTAQRAALRAAVVVLNETDVEPGFGKFGGVPGFEEEAA